ncbi:MAG: hypothetical protein HQM14_01245 [SAR324 cluster bacterium]|nr:hypothetical protein [SAR324 cluster bacterium]
MTIIKLIQKVFTAVSTLQEIGVVLIGSMIIAAAFTSPIFTNLENLGIEDWDEHLFYHAVPHRTLLEYKQIPLWNPYYCGGGVMLANPQSRFLSPSFVLLLLFGTVAGIKMEIFLHLVIGMLGCYLLGRYYKLDPLVAWIPSFVYMLSSMYALALSAGMSWFLSVAYVPWAIFWYVRSFETRWCIILTSLSLVLIFFGGGPYTLTITLLSFMVYSILGIRQYGVLKNLIILGGVLFFTISIGAIKFFPSYDFMKAHPRELKDYSGYSVESLYNSLFDREQRLGAIQKYFDEKTHSKPGFWSGISYHMDENGMYVGWIAGFLFLIGMGANLFRHWKLALLFLIFLWLGLGNRAYPSLWEFLHLFPVYDTMRVAQRFRIIFMLCFALFAGFGLQAIKTFVAQRQSKVVAHGVVVMLIVFVLGDLFLVNRGTFTDAFPIPPMTFEKPGDFVQVTSIPKYDAKGVLKGKDHVFSAWSALYPAFLLNMGTIHYDCFGNPDIPKNAIPANSSAYRGEVFLQDTQGNVMIDDWTPNRLKIAVNVSSTGYVVVNQNYYSGWHVDDGRPIEKWNGLLAIKVSPDDNMIELYYRPVSFVIGALVSLLTIALLVLLVFLRHKVAAACKKLEAMVGL